MCAEGKGKAGGGNETETKKQVSQVNSTSQIILRFLSDQRDIGLDIWGKDFY